VNCFREDIECKKKLMVIGAFVHFVFSSSPLSPVTRIEAAARQHRTTTLRSAVRSSLDESLRMWRELLRKDLFDVAETDTDVDSALALSLLKASAIGVDAQLLGESHAGDNDDSLATLKTKQCTCVDLAAYALALIAIRARCAAVRHDFFETISSLNSAVHLVLPQATQRLSNALQQHCLIERLPRVTESTESTASNNEPNRLSASRLMPAYETLENHLIGLRRRFDISKVEFGECLCCVKIDWAAV
jgi:hypothetical protein